MRDNFSTISSVKNHVFCSKPKHLKIKNYLVKDAHQSDEVNLVHCSCEDQFNEVNLVHCSSEDWLTDLFTKALPKNKFEELKEKIGVLHKNAEEY
ncbi:hypothetical protein Sjap_009574 [Stephania japonica]|uniref:Uncharacterized protein n=1 Tax=Stephania japonica TaxID=461633 RepID=A0AAP0JSL7_9MAGN